MRASPAATTLATLVLGGTLWAGARPIGPLPPLGGLLDPANGAWAAAAAAELPAEQRAGITGLGGDVRVEYDDRGVPHIFAPSEEDAIRALGWVVARDRLFQLEVQTLAAAGRLTEIGGERALPLDREMRQLALPEAAERKLAAIRGTRAERLVHAYAQGVNAYIDSLRPRDWPVEYRLLGRAPSRWEPLNTLLLMGRMGWTLAYDETELKHERAARMVGEEAADALFPIASPIQEPIQPNGAGAPRWIVARIPAPGAGGAGGAPDAGSPEDAVTGRSGPALARTGGEGGEGARAHATTLGGPPLSAKLRGGVTAPSDLHPTPPRVGAASPSHATPSDRARPFTLRQRPADAIGSNNWAVASARSASGHALLAGDPHLELTLPSIWYEAHLVVPGRMDVYGVTIPGASGIIIGFTRDIAWTFTNTEADVADWYVESVDDDDSPTRYRLDGAWRPLRQRIERYRDASGAVIATDTVRSTHRGPMRRVDGRWLSLRWTVLESARDIEAIAAIPGARDVDGFLRATAPWGAPAQNMLVADRTGAIAIRSTGRFPIRPGDGRGDRLRDGSHGAEDWTGDWSPDEYPLAVRPAQGFLASANQQPVDPSVRSRYLGSDWYAPWRALRINALLRGDSSATPDDFARWQTDPLSPRAELFRPAFLAAARARPGDAGLARAAALLAEWDGRYVKENTRAVLFEAAMEELDRRLWDELRAAPDDRPPLPAGSIIAVLLRDSASAWWDDRGTPAREACDDILAASLRAALDTVVARHGPPEAGGWRWDRIRLANIWHPLRIASLSALGLPMQGGPSTLNPSSGSGRFGASWRMIVEMGPEPRAWATYPGGQSGNPSSPRYRDRLASWSAGTLDSLRLPRAPGRLARTLSTLTLTPGARP